MEVLAMDYEELAAGSRARSAEEIRKGEFGLNCGLAMKVKDSVDGHGVDFPAAEVRARLAPLVPQRLLAYPIAFQPSFLGAADEIIPRGRRFSRGRLLARALLRTSVPVFHYIAKIHMLSPNNGL
jgi:hypothetical protein